MDQHSGLLIPTEPLTTSRSGPAFWVIETYRAPHNIKEWTSILSYWDLQSPSQHQGVDQHSGLLRPTEPLTTSRSGPAFWVIETYRAPHNIKEWTSILSYWDLQSPSQHQGVDQHSELLIPTEPLTTSRSGPAFWVTETYRAPHNIKEWTSILSYWYLQSPSQHQGVDQHSELLRPTEPLTPSRSGPAFWVIETYRAPHTIKEWTSILSYWDLQSPSQHQGVDQHSELLRPIEPLTTSRSGPAFWVTETYRAPHNIKEWTSILSYWDLQSPSQHQGVDQHSGLLIPTEPLTTSRSGPAWGVSLLSDYNSLFIIYHTVTELPLDVLDLGYVVFACSWYRE